MMPKALSLTGGYEQATGMSMPLVMLPDDSNSPILRAIMLALSFAISCSKYRPSWMIARCHGSLIAILNWRMSGLGLMMPRRAFGSDQVICLETPLSGNDRAIADRRSEGMVKVITHKNGRILGASILAPAAGEMILTWSHAIATKAKIGSIANLIVPYPTYSDSSKRIAGSFFTAKLFSPATQRFVRFLLKF
jgi:hypothetical protein